MKTVLNLIVFFHNGSFFHREKIKKLFGLKPVISDKNGTRYSGIFSGGRCYFDFADKNNLSDYSDEELAQIPYTVCDVCIITYYPFDIIYDLLDQLIEFDIGLYVDDDNDHIMNICDYREKLQKEEVYPFTYHCMKLQSAIVNIRYALGQNDMNLTERCAESIRQSREVLSSIDSASDLNKIMSDAINELEKLLAEKQYEKAYDLSDVIHALPEIYCSKEKDMASYWNDFICPYSLKWNDNYFSEYREMILNM